MHKIDHGRIEKADQRYYAAAHRIQTAVAFNPDLTPCQPKHMRVGIDMSKSDQAGLAQLLIDKGVFTLEEYHEAVATSAEQEAESREHDLSARYGINLRTY